MTELQRIAKEIANLEYKMGELSEQIFEREEYLRDNYDDLSEVYDAIETARYAIRG